MKKLISEEILRMQKLAGILNEVIDNYGEIQAAEDELAGGMETGDYTTEEEYLRELINASDDELMDFQGGYLDIARVLNDLNDEEKQEAITNIKNWAKNQIQ